MSLNPCDRLVFDIVQSLSKQFGKNSLLFKSRHQILKLIMNENADFLAHVCIINHECKRFGPKSLTEDQIKTLILIYSFQSQTFSDIKTRLLCLVFWLPTGTMVYCISYKSAHLNNIVARNVSLSVIKMDFVKGENQIDHHIRPEASRSLLTNPV